MKLRKNNSQGFSIIEMTLASFLVLGISAVSYRVLKSQTNTQLSAIENQKTDTVSQTALARFKADASAMDSNWTRYGIAAIYPHQGYGLGQNYYLLSELDRKHSPVVNDGVTFLRRVPNSDRFYVPVGTQSRICYPTPIVSTDNRLYDSNIQLDSVEGLHEGDWLLFYQAGHYALGVIAEVIQSQTTVATNTNNNSNNNEAAESMTMNSSQTNQVQGTMSSGANDGIEDTSRFISISGGTINGETTTSVVTTSFGMIRLRRPNTYESQMTANTVSGISNGFVTKPGVVAANFDMNGNATTDTTDNSYCFDAPKANFQKISPVSYYVDYRTSDGKEKSSSNAYMLDKKKGEQIKMLVRSEYVNGIEKREYLAPIDDLAITYDLINRSGAGDKIARDVGRTKNSGYLQDLNAYDTNHATSNFLTSYQIVAMKMNIGFETKDKNKPDQTNKQNKEIKIALDPSMQQDAYRDEITIASSLTDNLNTLNSTKTERDSVTNEQIGKPLYLLNSGSDKNEVIVPVSTFKVLTDGQMSDESKGALYVYNPDGCAVNAKSGCDPSNNRSAIVFDLGSNTRFFPNTVTEVTQADGIRKIIVGGVAMKKGENIMERIPGVGIITLGENETLAAKLSAGGGTSSCNINNCDWKPINNKISDKADFVDTALLASDPGHPNDLYVATMTKQSGETSQSAVYKGTWNGSDYEYVRFANVQGTEDGKIISAISDRPIKVGDDSYLAVCVTKKMSSSCGGECITDTVADSMNVKSTALEPVNQPLSESTTGNTPRGGSTSNDTGAAVSLEDTLGEIQLVKQGSGVESPGITLIRHNYRCSAINVDLNGNLIVSGRLTVQPIAYADVKKAVEYRTEGKDIAKADELLMNNILYLDEAVSVEGRNTVYADYYQVDPATYKNNKNAQMIGWLSGTSTVEFSDGTFGMVNGNKYRIADEKESTPKEYSNAGISKIELAGMSDRVVATIQFDPNNINNSIVSATYAKRSNELPSVYIPGTFWVNKYAIRNTPTPLPSVSPAMSEKSWFQLYQALLTPRDATGLNSQMPTFSSENYNKIGSCSVSKPKTCS